MSNETRFTVVEDYDLGLYLRLQGEADKEIHIGTMISSWTTGDEVAFHMTSLSELIEAEVDNFIEAEEIFETAIVGLQNTIKHCEKRIAELKK